MRAALAIAAPPRAAPRRMPDRELVRRCLAQDGEAWRALYARYIRQVAQLCRHNAGDAEQDDLCQEIFLIVFRHLASFRGEGRLRAWIERLAAREAIRAAKRVRQRRARRKWLGGLARGRPARADVDTAPAGRRYLEELLNHLPPERQRALVLFEIEGRSVDEIAELCGCAVNTVWTRIHRARAQLKEIAGNA